MIEYNILYSLKIICCIISQNGYNYTIQGGDYMYNVLDVARYVINYENQKGNKISNLKLQKLLYFIQALFLITEPYEPCFKEDIEAWDFGPVIPEVYHEFKSYGNRNIPPVKQYYDFSDGFWRASQKIYDEDIIWDEDKGLIDSVLDQFKDYSASDLVSITHNQKPWRTAYRKWGNSIISKEAIQNYFNED